MLGRKIMNNLYSSVCGKYSCLEAVALTAYYAFFQYYSQDLTSLWQRPQMGRLVLNIVRGLYNLGTALVPLITSHMVLGEGTLDQLLEDCERMFAALERMDFERAVWMFMTSRQTHDHTFKRLVEFSKLLDTRSSFHKERIKCCQCWFCSVRNTNFPAHGCFIETTKNAVWQVSCHIPPELSPSPPPPPYTLYAFNIELPPIRYPAVTARHSSVEKPSRLGKRKRCDSEDVDALRPSMRRICDVEDVEETHPDRRAVSEQEDTEDEDEHHPKRRLLKEPENVAYIREQRLLRFQCAV